MKKLNRILLICAGILMGFISCKDDSLVVIPEWETGVNTYATLQAGTPTSWVAADVTKTMNLNWRWISIDQKNTVVKVELFLLFNEAFTDIDANPGLARHGGSAGKLWKTIEGAGLKGNREDIQFTVTQDDAYQLYKDNTYNYCGTTVPVFGNALKPDRTPAAPFLKGDTFTVKWTVYTEDGRKFDSWSPSVCTEFPGSNCLYSWGVTGTDPLPGKC